MGKAPASPANKLTASTQRIITLKEEAAAQSNKTIITQTQEAISKTAANVSTGITNNSWILPAAIALILLAIGLTALTLHHRKKS